MDTLHSSASSGYSFTNSGETANSFFPNCLRNKKMHAGKSRARKSKIVFFTFIKSNTWNKKGLSPHLSLFIMENKKLTGRRKLPCLRRQKQLTSILQKSWV